MLSEDTFQSECLDVLFLIQLVAGSQEKVNYSLLNDSWTKYLNWTATLSSPKQLPTSG